jgi:thioredoxin-related protein
MNRGNATLYGIQHFPDPVTVSMGGGNLVMSVPGYLPAFFFMG